jgi:hypothetical protein
MTRPNLRLSSKTDRIFKIFRIIRIIMRILLLLILSNNALDSKPFTLYIYAVSNNVGTLPSALITLQPS